MARTLFIIIIIFAGAYLASQAFYALSDFVGSDGTEVEETQVYINDAVFVAETARTQEEVSTGLSGRPRLAKNKGMLFIFSTAGFYQFWMPNMHFPIDIIWINDSKVVDITENVSNIFDPANPTYYRPSEAVNYVLEVNAGSVLRHGIKVGDSVFIETLPSR